MSIPVAFEFLQIADEVRDAIAAAQPVVALETTFAIHGLPSPDNLEVIAEIRNLCAEHAVVPAFVGVVRGRLTVGLSDGEIEALVETKAVKVSRRDLPFVLATDGYGATTVAGTMIAARLSGIALFATGGIGGVHRDVGTTMDVSADLCELGRTAVAVICSGVKSILDLPRTNEYLETLGVPVVGYRTDTLPGFYTRESPVRLEMRIDSVAAMARLVKANQALGHNAMVIANPVAAEAALDPEQLEQWIDQALAEARKGQVTGKQVTPFVLKRLFQLSDGATLIANKTLLIDNARLGAELASAMSVAS